MGGVHWARRAIDAEAELAEAKVRIAELEGHLAAFLRAAGDPHVMQRAHLSEALLREVVHPFAPQSDYAEWKREWLTRVSAQLRVVEIADREGL